MAIMIHGKEYVTVAERLKMLHDREDLRGKYSIASEVLSHNPVVVKVTLTIDGQIFEGISAANPNKPIEKQSPYEVAQSSACGRALVFAGFGLSEQIASADEMVKAEYSKENERASRSAVIQSRTVDEYETAQTCQKCNANALVLRRSRTGANAGKEYYYCQAHQGFSHWATPVAA